MRVGSALCRLGGPHLCQLVHGACQLMLAFCQLMLGLCQLMSDSCQLSGHTQHQPRSRLHQLLIGLPQILLSLCQLMRVLDNDRLSCSDGRLGRRKRKRKLEMLDGGSAGDLR